MPFQSHRGVRPFLLLTVVMALASGGTTRAAEVDYGGYRPHYQGYGVDTRGGRGGTVHRVTHLRDTIDPGNANWNGSFRKAVTAPGARFVIFDVSGTIALVSPVIITNPFVTIAGQTAPSPGITLRNNYLQIDTNDVVIQHLRIRPGAVGGLPHGVHVRNGAHRIVLDHLSVSWTVWTAIDLHAQDAPAANIGDVTLIDSIVSEVLSCSGVNVAIPCDPVTMTGTPHSRGVLVGDNNTSKTYNNGRTRFAMIRNLSASNDSRHPAIQGPVDTFIVNNLIYNPSLQPISGIFFSDDYGRGGANAVILGNHLIPGPTTPGHNNYVPRFYASSGELFMFQLDFSTSSATRIFLEGNYYARHCGGTTCLDSPQAQWSLVYDKPALQGRVLRADAPPLSLANLPRQSVLPYTAVEVYVTANAGARPLDRDPVDTRVINTVRTRTGRSINTPADVGGHPVLAENRRVLTLPADPNAVVDGAGRTRIESWLELIARALEPARASTLKAPGNVRILQSAVAAPANVRVELMKILAPHNVRIVP